MKFEEFKSKYLKTPVHHYKSSVTKTPLVSVCVQTYQHVGFIKDCLEGIINQVTDFHFEVLLGEDCSTDGTREICKEYAEKYPDKIRLFLHERENNIHIYGMPTGRFNFFYNLYNAQGKYIAFCEGDDYWNDPYKLQKQHDFLEANSDCSVCFTSALFKNETEPTKSYVYHPRKVLGNKKFELKDAIFKAGEFMPSASMFFRKEYLIDIPNWFFDSPVGDMPLSLYLGSHGKYGYLNSQSVVYRIMSPTSWSSAMSFERRRKVAKGLIEMLENFNKYTNYEFKTLIDKEIRRVGFNDRKSVIKRVISNSYLGQIVKKIIGKESN